MTIAYYSLDEVNRCFVSRWLKAAGIATVFPAAGALAEPAPGAAAVVLDFDTLPADVAAAWTRTLLHGRIGRPVMVHGHNLSDAAAAAFQGRGVRVCRTRVRKATLVRWAVRPARRETVGRRLVGRATGGNGSPTK